MPRTIPTVETINQTVGSRIKRLREDMGISQRGLCRLAGLSPTTLITVENGSGSISAVNLLAVAEALDTTPDWFYGDLLMESRHRDQLDRNWFDYHEMCINKIKEALGMPDTAIIPEMIQAIVDLRNQLNVFKNQYNTTSPHKNT